MGRDVKDHFMDERGEHKTRIFPKLKAGSVLGQRGKLHINSGKTSKLDHKRFDFISANERMEAVAMGSWTIVVDWKAVGYSN